MPEVKRSDVKERYSGWFPLSYEVSVTVTGGQFVEADAANPGKVKVAAAGSEVHLGMAKYRAVPGSEFAEYEIGQGQVINNPQPRNVACAHVGAYDLINEGAVALQPGQSVQVVGSAGGVGRNGTGNGTEPTTRAVVGTVLGHAKASGYTVEPTPVGARVRIRLGRG